MLSALPYKKIPLTISCSLFSLKDSDDDQEADYDPEREGSPASDDDLIEDDSDEEYELDKSGGEVGPATKRQRLEEPTEDEP